MEDGSLYPSIYMKMQGQPWLFIRNFHKTQASNSIPSTCGSTLAFFNGVLQSHLGPSHEGSASSTVPSRPSKSVGVPFIKGNAVNPAFRTIHWVTFMMTTAPLNRVKLLMQCQNEMIKSGRLSHLYKGIGNCFATTVRNEGILSLWKGNTAHVMGVITSKVMREYTTSYIMSLFNFKKDKESYGKKLAGLLAADIFSRAVTLFLVHPLDYATTRMANDIRTKSNVGKRQFNGIIDVFRKTLKSDGIAGLYRGYNMAYVAWFVNDVLLLVSQSNLLLQMVGLQKTVLATAILGTGILLFANLITYPMNTVVQRMMMRSGEAIKYKSSSHAFSQILKNEGVQSLYKGASAIIIKFAVSVGIVIVMMFFTSQKKKKAGSGRSDQPTYSIDIKWEKGENGDQGSH